MRETRAATYGDYVRAERAVARLDEEGISRKRTVVVGRDWQPRHVSPARARAERARRGAVTGLAGGAMAIAALLLAGAAGGSPAAVVVGLVAGAAGGALGGVLWSMWADRTTSGERLVPSQWDVVCLGDAGERPSQVLARWWDGTVPVQPHTPAGATVRAA
ncbi:MAG TPA: hypothetical protein VHN98_11710 [Acidimicrobiales bacterium]|nr:hypothetical protein [Acidimicrobiales bacterium]